MPPGKKRKFTHTKKRKLQQNQPEEQEENQPEEQEENKPEEQDENQPEDQEENQPEEQEENQPEEQEENQPEEQDENQPEEQEENQPEEQEENQPEEQDENQPEEQEENQPEEQDENQPEEQEKPHPGVHLKKRILILASTSWEGWMRTIEADSNHHVIVCESNVNCNSHALSAIERFHQAGEKFDCIVMAPSHGHIRMFRAMWEKTGPSDSEDLLPLLEKIAEYDLTTHVHLDTCNLGNCGLEYMISPLIKTKLRTITGWGGEVGCPEHGLSTNGYINLGCPHKINIESNTDRNAWQHLLLIWTSQETLNQYDKNPFRSNTKWDKAMFIPVKKALEKIFKLQLPREEKSQKGEITVKSEVNLQAGIIQRGCSSLQQNYLLSKLPTMKEDEISHFDDDTFDYTDKEANVNRGILRDILKKTCFLPKYGSIEQVHFSQITLNWAMGPVMLHAYADMKKFGKATGIQNISGTEDELSPTKWSIEPLHEIYKTMLCWKIAEVKTSPKSKGGKPKQCVLCLAITFLFNRNKTEQHVIHITLQWCKTSNKVIAIYEDLGYTAKHAQNDFAMKVGTLQCRYRFSCRIKTFAANMLEEAGNIKMEHVMQYPLQPYSTNTCGIALMFKLHFGISDQLMHRVLHFFHWHPDFQHLYELMQKKTPVKPNDWEDRTCQLLLLKLYDQWLCAEYPNLLKNSADFAKLYNTENMKVHDQGICRICHQTDFPSELIGCEYEVDSGDHTCGFKCKTKCVNVCVVYEHIFCMKPELVPSPSSPSSPSRRPWYCEDCAKKSNTNEVN